MRLWCRRRPTSSRRWSRSSRSSSSPTTSPCCGDATLTSRETSPRASRWNDDLSAQSRLGRREALMSGLRDVVLLLVVIGLVPVCLIRPWLGILAWYWIAFMVPHGLTWGFARTLPVAMLIGGATLVGWVCTKDRKPIPRTVTVIALLLLAADFTLTTTLAYNPMDAWNKWERASKILLMTFVTMTLFQERARLRWLYMVTALGLGFYGLKGGIWVFRTGGSERVFGPDKSFFADNNTLGLALCMILPMLLYLSREEPRPWLKKGLRVMFFFTTVAILFTYSRGAFLGLSIVLGILAWRSPWRVRFATTVLVCSLV